MEPVDLDKLDELRDIADHLGVSMTDVFAADRIIWVEGPTEELCFPFIYKETVGPLPRGLTFTPVVATGDFNAKVKRRDLIFQVYERLSKATSRLVKSVTFSFDREALTDRQMRDLDNAAGGRLMFLPRRLLECFLLDPAAVAAFINARVEDLADPVLPKDVLSYLQRVGGEAKFKASRSWNGSIFHEQWLAEVDAAALLRDVCSDLSEARVSFNKTRHSLEILQHIMAHNRESLKGLNDYVKELVELASASASSPK